MSLLSAVCTFAGIWFIGNPRPGNGALPMTVTCGNSSAVAGLLGSADATVAAADAGAGSAEAPTQSKPPRSTVFVACANHPFLSQSTSRAVSIHGGLQATELVPPAAGNSPGVA